MEPFGVNNKANKKIVFSMSIGKVNVACIYLNTNLLFANNRLEASRRWEGKGAHGKKPFGKILDVFSITKHRLHCECFPEIFPMFSEYIWGKWRLVVAFILRTSLPHTKLFFKLTQ